MRYVHPDLHLHSDVSDGSDSPAGLLERVREAGIDIFSLTDHDTYLGCDEVRKNLTDGDPTFLGGIELSCVDGCGKYHILGYCYDVNKESIREAAEVTHRARRDKARHRIRYLEEVCGFTFTEDELCELLSNENPGKPHFVALLMKKGYVSTKKEGFELMDGYKGKERKLTPEEAVGAILNADGIPVLAHGILGDGSELLTPEEMDARVERLKGYGLMGLECYYSSYTEEQTDIMLSLAEKYNLLVTAGSDYHGANKTVPLGAVGNPDPEKMERFYRAVHKLLGY